MLQLRYFASLRDQLDCDNEELSWQDHFSTVSDIKNHLSERNEHWQQLLSKNTILIAINQQMVNANSPVKDGDEIAFFPPVTGG